MAIDEIPTPTTPMATSLFPSPKAHDTHHFPHPSFSQTFSDSMMQENIENAEAIITKWDPKTSSLESFVSLFQENPKEAEGFTKCVGDLRSTMHILVAQRSASNHLTKANKLMKIAMLRLEKELYYILLSNRECLIPESLSTRSSHLSRSLSLSNSGNEEEEEYYHVESDGEVRIPKTEQAMADLKLIAETMISSGYSKECGKLYRITRKSITDEQLYRLGIRSYTQNQINKMDQQALEHEINKWIDRAKVAVRAIFRGEQILCDHVYAVSETLKQTCLAHITMEAAINLFKFPEFVAKSKRSPDKIFLMMNLFEAITDLWPEIETIFSYESLSPGKLQALSAMDKLSHSAQTILSDFVSSIQKNSSKTPIPGGGIHPLTCSVMNYVSLLAENSGVLSDILAAEEADAGRRSPLPESYFDGAAAADGVSSRLAWIILVLLCKLDSKAELYKDIALSYLFLANNLQFVVEKVGATALKLVLGDEWLSKLQKKVKLYAAKYESVAWANVVSSLRAETEELPEAIKEHFRRFVSAFEAAYRKQRSWVVPDPKLRDEIKVSIARKVVPAYREFYDGYLGILGVEKNLEVLVRFSPDNLGNYLSDLFHGTPHDVVSGNSSSFLLSSQSRLSRCL